jgi:hypothetical protein
MDRSYDFSWDHKFPVDGSALWPRGKLLQLQRLAFSSHFREKRHIVFLLPSKLVIAEQTDPDPDLPWGILNDGSGHRFYSGQTHNEQEYDASSIAKVELGLSAVTMGIAIWIDNKKGKTKRVFKAHGIGMPQVVEDLADESVKQGIGRPSPRLIKMKEVNVYRTQLLYRIIERQFRMCSPHAEIDLVGEQMPEEVFQRILK